MKSEGNFRVKIRELTIFDLFRVNKLAEVYFDAFNAPTESISRIRLLYYLIRKRNHFFLIAEKKKCKCNRFRLCSYIQYVRLCFPQLYCC